MTTAQTTPVVAVVLARRAQLAHKAHEGRMLALIVRQ